MVILCRDNAMQCGDAGAVQPVKSDAPARMEAAGYRLLANVFLDKHGWFTDGKRTYRGLAENGDGTWSVEWYGPGFASEEKEGRFENARLDAACDAGGNRLPDALAIYVKPLFSDTVERALDDTRRLAGEGKPDASAKAAGAESVLSEILRKFGEANEYMPPFF